MLCKDEQRSAPKNESLFENELSSKSQAGVTGKEVSFESLKDWYPNSQSKDQDLPYTDEIKCDTFIMKIESSIGSTNDDDLNIIYEEQSYWEEESIIQDFTFISPSQKIEGKWTDNNSECSFILLDKPIYPNCFEDNQRKKFEDRFELSSKIKHYWRRWIDGSLDE